MKVQKYKLGDIVKVKFNNFFYDLRDIPDRLKKCGCELDGLILGIEILNSVERYFIKVQFEDNNISSKIMPFLVDDIIEVKVEGLPRRRSVCKDCPINIHYGGCDSIDRKLCTLNTKEFLRQIYIGDTVKFSGNKYIVLGEYRCPDVNIIDWLSGIQEQSIDINNKIGITRYRNCISYNSSEYKSIISCDYIYYLIREKKFANRNMKFNSRKFYSYVRSSDVLLMETIDQEPDRENTNLCSICILYKCDSLCRWKNFKTL